MKSGPMAPRNRRTWGRSTSSQQRSPTTDRPSIENVELSSPVQHNASTEKNPRTTVMVSFLDVTGIKPYPDLSPNQNALIIASGTEPTLIPKEDTTPMTAVQFLCSLHHCKRWRWWSTFNGRQFRTAGE
ncbi:uncharacterized protein TNCV_782321 [Trichonephila clavipes]|nr:uncharacterized protein TNCV_782321 [Trichonephila clavipes]